MARAFGWTMREVRRTTYRDLAAYAEVLVDEARKQRMKQARKRVPR